MYCGTALKMYLDSALNLKLYLYSASNSKCQIRKFMQNYDFLALPVSQVPPFPLEQEYVSEINGMKMETYLDWMRSCYYITVTGQPAISVPSGFTDDGLPVGLQLVGRPQDDFGVLQLAYAFEKATGFYKKVPDLALAL